ncbi:lethal(3)malignant brain tumor-like protein 3 isoform X2 [Bacillus rossius redtenbacheri]|uniref:lethal(3)malignant brain tumor-like protein 3 isoform X2 n=1 Tax=Bacillus rossius redtenbacheri TaxID=93214 RepID=UPI002FDDF618
MNGVHMIPTGNIEKKIMVNVSTMSVPHTSILRTDKTEVAGLQGPLAPAQQHQSAGTPRMLPLLYIQSSPPVRINASSAATSTITGTVSAQTATSTMRPTIVTSNSHQFIPAALSTKTAGGTKNMGSQPHFLIQTSRPGTQVPVSGGNNKHTITYFSTILKPGVGVPKAGDGTQLVLPAGQLQTNILPGSNQKLVLAPLPVLPSSTSGSGCPAQPGKLTSVLMPVSLAPQVGSTKSNMINLKIANGQIHHDGKGPVTVLRETKPMSGPASPAVPPLQPLGKFPSKVKCVNTNGVIISEPTAMTSMPLGQFTHLVPIAPKKHGTSDESRMATASGDGGGAASSKSAQEEEDAVEERRKRSQNRLHEALAAVLNNSSTSVSNNSSTSILNNSSAAVAQLPVMSVATQANIPPAAPRPCLSPTPVETDISSVLHINAVSVQADGSGPMQVPDDESSNSSVAAESSNKSLDGDSKSKVSSKLMSMEKNDKSKGSSKLVSVEKNGGDVSDSDEDKCVIVDDINIEVIKSDKSEPVKTRLEPFDSKAEDFDPIKVLEWKDGIGTLPGSRLKFRMNEFGLMEMVEDEDYEKMLNKSAVTSEPVVTDHKEGKSPGASISVGNEKDGAVGNNLKQNDAGETEDSLLNGPNKENTKAKLATSSSRDDIYCCESCGCYGLSSEFVSTLFCSHTCATSYAAKQEQQSRKEREVLQLRLRRRKKRLLHLMKQQQMALQKHLQPPPGGSPAAAATAAATAATATTPAPGACSSKASSCTEEDAASSDTGQRVPWLAGKSGFSWTKYLDCCKAKAAPTKLFKDPFPYMKNGFKTGMKMEGIDPEHPSVFCVLTVMDVQGYRMRLHFDGYPVSHDFWVNADSMDIFPAGWCEKNNHKLQPPKTIHANTFNWGSYLKLCRAQAAPRNLFANKTGSSICPNAFRLGMKLEAVDRKNVTVVRVATVANLLDSRILVHFDNLDKKYDYWADPSSPYIHPVGWCKENKRFLTPPPGFKAEPFSWEQYLKETKAVAAPARAFKQRPASGFRPDMRLECVDPRVPSIVRVATVADVKGHQIKIQFDGWHKRYSFWVDDDSPDIHPVGWCLKTGHPIEPPLSADETDAEYSCPTVGCKGVGHVKGPKFPNHNTVAACPYASQNLSVDGHIPDRLSGLADSADEKTETCQEVSKPSESRKHPGRPPKWRKIEVEDIKQETLEVNGIEDDEDEEQKKRKRPVKDKESPSPSKMDILRKELQQSILDPGYEVNANKATPFLWAKHSLFLTNYVHSVQTADNPAAWTKEDVARFVASIPGCESKANVFISQHIDGEAFLMMAQSDLIRIVGFKLGPAIKVYNSIVLLRQKTGKS